MASSVQAEEPTPSIGPVPSWVVEPTVPPPNAGRTDAPFQLLLSSSQERLLPDGVENYIDVATLPQTTAGLQALGNIVLPWNAERTELTIHRVAIRRGATTINLLKPNAFMVLRRENNLEKAMLDGVRTVVIPAQGLQTGDILEIAATYKTRKTLVGGKPDDVFQMRAGTPTMRIERRLLVPDSIKARWKMGLANISPQTVKRDGATEYVFTQAYVEPVELPKNVPSRFKSPILHVSAYQDWSEVSGELAPLFDKARATSAGSGLASEADKIAASTADPAKRMLEALRLAQDRVRYVALLLGDGAYVPSGADETWERKFGDCKGKTALMLALLDKLGVQAEPLLVSSGFDDQLGEALPSLALFDHVLVRAKIGGKAYYLDATDYGQRTLEELEATPFTQGLPLRKQAGLEKLVSPLPGKPMREATLVWNAAKGTDGKIPYEATLTLRGDAASETRAKLDAATDVKEFEKGLKDMMPGVPNDDLVIAEKKPDGPEGTFVVRFAGNAEMDWSPFEGEKDSRFQFSHNVVHWDADFQRKEGPGKDMPVSLGAGRYWEHMTETIILPNGGKGYEIEGTQLQKSLAGSSMSRSLKKEGDRITMVSDFRHLKREISAEEARTGQEQLAKLNEDWAYVVGPPLKKKKSR
jgi:transglutaminase-like putative cysteine protease